MVACQRTVYKVETVGQSSDKFFNSNFTEVTVQVIGALFYVVRIFISVYLHIFGQVVGHVAQVLGFDLKE